MSSNLRQVTLVFLLRDNQILLAMKKRGFGAGKWNGCGGKPDFGEQIEDTARRETKEEIGVTPGKMQKVAVIDFYSPNGMEENNQQAVVYFCNDWQGDPVETEEMRPEWFDLSSIPCESMWADDRFWLPEVIAGRKVFAEFFFDKHNNVTKHQIKDLDNPVTVI